MRLVLYPRLNLRSKRAILRTKNRWGHPVRYNPRKQLLQRLSEEFKIPEETVRKQLLEERKFLLDNFQYFR
jgi:hypothetical protein